MFDMLLDLAKLYDIIDRNHFHLTAADAQLFGDVVQSFLQRYAWLCSDCQARDRKTWHLTIKFHMEIHLAEQSRFMNPKLGWNYGYEDFVGKVVRIAKSCLVSRAHVKVPEKVLSKYLLALSIRISRLCKHR